MKWLKWATVSHKCCRCFFWLLLKIARSASWDKPHSCADLVASVLHQQSDGDDDTKRHSALLSASQVLHPPALFSRCAGVVPHGGTWRGQVVWEIQLRLRFAQLQPDGRLYMVSPPPPTVSVWQVVVKPDFSLTQSHRETLWNRSSSPFALSGAWKYSWLCVTSCRVWLQVQQNTPFTKITSPLFKSKTILKPHQWLG